MSIGRSCAAGRGRCARNAKVRETDRRDQEALHALPAQDGWRLPGEAGLRPFAYPVAQHDRSEGSDAAGRPVAGGLLAITGGCVYRGDAIPALRGHSICGDLVNWRVFRAPVGGFWLGARAELRELTLRQDGQIVTLRWLVGTSGRADLRLGEGEDGAACVLTKQDGKIRKLVA